jgi:hypothetical protein
MGAAAPAPIFTSSTRNPTLLTPDSSSAARNATSAPVGTARTAGR